MAEAANKSQGITQGKIVSDKQDLSWDMLSCSFPAFSPRLSLKFGDPCLENSSGALGCEFILENTNTWIYNELGTTASQSQSGLVSPKAQRRYKGDLFVYLFLELYFKLG